jgi:methyltransferase (TIGR00027 family)
MKIKYSKTIEKSCGFVFALWSAGAKAFEYSLPKNMRVIEDPLARYYASAAGLKMVEMLQSFNPALRKSIVLRARYMDDYARKCLHDGYDQIVLMGAGYDSRFWRIPEFRQADVYELDLESTQLVKKSLTRRLMGGLPPNVKYISMDFSKHSIAAKLKTAGFKDYKKTLFIWEGVTLFLNLDIVLDILGHLKEIAQASRVVFDFVPPELIEDETNYQGNRKLIELCASIKEPLTFGCHPHKMKMILQSLGYINIKIVNMSEANRIYCGSNNIEDCYFFATAETPQAINVGLQIEHVKYNSEATKQNQRMIN